MRTLLCPCLKSGLLSAAVLSFTVVLGATECRAQTPIASGRYTSGALYLGSGDGVGLGIQTSGGIWYEYRGGSIYGWHLEMWDNHSNGVFVAWPTSVYQKKYVLYSFYGYKYDHGQPTNRNLWQFKESGVILVDIATGAGLWGAKTYNNYTPSSMSLYYFSFF
jgi:hypothetical protein